MALHRQRKQCLRCHGGLQGLEGADQRSFRAESRAVQQCHCRRARCRVAAAAVAAAGRQRHDAAQVGVDACSTRGATKLQEVQAAAQGAGVESAQYRRARAFFVQDHRDLSAPPPPCWCVGQVRGARRGQLARRRRLGQTESAGCHVAAPCCGSHGSPNALLLASGTRSRSPGTPGGAQQCREGPGAPRLMELQFATSRPPPTPHDRRT